MRELVISVAELWLVLTYLHEQPDLVDALPWFMLIALLGLLLSNLDRLDLPKLLASAKEAINAKRH